MRRSVFECSWRAQVSAPNNYKDNDCCLQDLPSKIESDLIVSMSSYSGDKQEPYWVSFWYLKISPVKRGRNAKELKKNLTVVETVCYNYGTVTMVKQQKIEKNCSKIKDTVRENLWDYYNYSFMIEDRIQAEA